MNEQLKSIQEAYECILFEGKEAKFKVGDKIGIGSNFNNHYMEYYGHDTGTVTKVNANGHHTVQFDNRKSADDHTKPYTEQFDHKGESRKQYSNLHIRPLDDHNRLIKTRNDKMDRNRDLGTIKTHIDGQRDGFGNFHKFSKEHAEHIKSLIDKHTEE